MQPDLQPILENQRVILYPLRENDFDALYAVASDPKVWEQHPNKDRWKEDVFRTFFDGAMESKGAFKIVDQQTREVIGSTRYYEYNEKQNSIFVGYTFYATRCWGKGINRSVKELMFDYIFRFVSTIYLHVGAGNIRSQIAVARLGAEKTGEQTIAYFGEEPRLNFEYRIDKSMWMAASEAGRVSGQH
jgi:RimJ/RimL family protein N-acetyltransferase